MSLNELQGYPSGTIGFGLHYIQSQIVQCELVLEERNQILIKAFPFSYISCNQLYKLSEMPKLSEKHAIAKL